jgi:hypothetical protein
MQNIVPANESNSEVVLHELESTTIPFSSAAAEMSATVVEATSATRRVLLQCSLI